MIKKQTSIGKIFIKIIAFVLVMILVGLLISLTSTGDTTTIEEDATTTTTYQKEILTDSPVASVPSAIIPSIDNIQVVPITSTPSIPPSIKARQSSTLTDMGYDENNATPGFPVRDWYDYLGQGVANDYCREVGDKPNNTFYACALAGATDQYTKVDINNKAFANAKRVAPPKLDKVDVIANKINKALIKSTIRDNYCIDVSAYNPNNEAKIQVWDCHGGVNQQFTYNKDTKQISTAYNKCLDVSGVSNDDLAKVWQWDCHSGDNQKWEIQANSDNTVTFIAKHSGKCLDVLYSGKENGTQVQQYTCNNSAAQKFTV